jgi:D-glycero-alpha-D-manno-heptose-7-phosphate kinase
VVITRTPFRVSFFGGGTDYPAWFREHGGAVVSCSINRYCYIMARHLPQFFDLKHRIVWSKIEQVDRIDQIEHPAVRAVFQEHAIDTGMEIHHQGDLPAKSGIGSSSAFSVGLIHAMHSLQGRMRSKEQLTAEAIHLEQNVLQENVGIQDQIAAAHGGLNLLEFDQGGAISVRPVSLPASKISKFQDHMLLFYTGISRFSSDIAGETIKNIPAKATDLRTLREMVNQAVQMLQEDTDFEEFGRLLDESWQLKRMLTNRVTTEQIDEVYYRAINAGALGGKLLGAGGGGFMLFIAAPEFHDRLRNALSDLLYVPFQIDFTGSQVVYYNPST